MIDNTLLFLCAKWHYRYEDSTGVCKVAHSGQQKYLRVCAISLMKMLVYGKEAGIKITGRKPRYSVLSKARRIGILQLFPTFVTLHVVIRFIFKRFQ